MRRFPLLLCLLFVALCGLAWGEDAPTIEQIRKETDVSKLVAVLRMDKVAAADLRREALWRLPRQIDARVTDVVISIAEDSKDPLRRNALNRLRDYDDPRALTVLLSAVHDPDENCAKAALESLANSSSPLAKAAILRRVEEKAADADLDSLMSYLSRREGFGGEIPLLGYMSSSSSEHILNDAANFYPLLTSPRAPARAAGILLMAMLRNLRATTPATTLLLDRDENVRRAAAFALGHLGDVRALPALTAAFAKEGSAKVRATMIAAFGKIGDLRALETLSAALNDPDDAIHIEAALSLALLEDPRGYDTVIAALADAKSDPRLRVRATEALAILADPRAVPALEAALNDQYNAVRIRAIDALATIGDEKAIQILVRTIKDGKRGEPLSQMPHLSDPYEIMDNQFKIADPRVRAVESLGKVHDPATLDSLLTALDAPDVDQSVRGAISDVLVNFKDPRVVQVLIKQANAGAYQAVYALSKFGKEGDEALLDIALDPNTSFATLMNALASASNKTSSLLMKDERLLDRMNKFANVNTNEMFLVNIISFLCQRSDPSSVEPLLPIVLMTDRNASDMAIRALIAIHEAHPDAPEFAAAIPVLQEAEKSTNDYLAMSARRALVLFGHPQYLDAILKAANSDDRRIRGIAITALEGIKDPLVEEFFIKIMRDPERHMRDQAYYWLYGMFKDTPVDDIPYIPGLWGDDYEVRENAIGIFPADAPGTVARLSTLIDADEPMRRKLLTRIVWNVSEDSIWLLIGMLHDTAQLTPSELADSANNRSGAISSLRIIAAYCLGKLGNPLAVEPLIDMLDEGDLVCRQAAAEALGQLKDKRAVPALIDAVEHCSGSARKAAAEALAAISGEKFGADVAAWREWWKKQNP